MALSHKSTEWLQNVIYKVYVNPTVVLKNIALHGFIALHYTNQMLHSCHIEKGHSVPVVTNGVSLIYRSVWSNIYRKHRLTETRAAMTQLGLPAVAVSQAQFSLDQSR